MTVTRLVDSESSGSIATLAAVLNSTPRPTVLVSFVRPYKDVRERLEAEGVQLDGVFIIDATPNPSLESFRPDAFFIGSPTLLERVAIICDKVLPRIGGKAQIVLYDHATVVTYNGPDMTRQFMHHLISQSQRNQCDMDILVSSPPHELRALADQTLQAEALA